MISLDVPSLGNRTHLVHDGEVAVVVDAPREASLVEEATEKAGVEIVAVADTHVHNDYVSGGLALAQRHGADYLLSAAERVEFERTGVRHGDLLTYGRLQVEVMDTPGHTRHHQSFLARPFDAAEGTAAPGVLLSGGSLLHGAVGRTDLVDPALTVLLARAQWRSARNQGELDPETVLLPTHGFGSFCAASATGADDGRPVTVADQLTRNPALTQGQEQFVVDLVAGLGPIPAYYPHMDPLNRTGAGAAAPRPPQPVTAGEVDAAVRAGAWVVDLRTRSEFAAGHLPGSVGLEYSGQFATYAGWLVPWGEQLVLLTDTPEHLAAAIHDLSLIGIDGVSTHVLTGHGADPDPALTSRFRRADWAELRDTLAVRRPVVVDVRQRDEWVAGHLPDAVHLPVQDVGTRGDVLPAGELWVHCRSGYRAGIAAGLLHRAGRHVVHVDDDWDRVAALALPTTTAA